MKVLLKKIESHSDIWIVVYSCNNKRYCKLFTLSHYFSKESGLLLIPLAHVFSDNTLFRYLFLRFLYVSLTLNRTKNHHYKIR
ncbi:hypothetical protein SARI_00197 [Salmonella enterica subsp. arizonae serovar 62:z4,z23:-]|uniref:Uncharacterized protein n=1 Tax=Salmonella arizonae (strain ATCC BAA-731 / CDC346-86 / RSK2980) TaxID=41514 RepID=A9MG36_SALAR|nr:hypothetical protein SARI_00197 [Salmonella enterica subsp. arizonae serovar 62:z4,z23:-]